MVSYEKEEGNPFRTGHDLEWSVGLDGKIGVTSDLTLDFTINPDFGQVEADPSALALDGFQVFFPEQRPFFIEGRNIFDYRMTTSEAGGPYTSDVLFYSRRIGGSPHGYPNLSDDMHANIPSNTSILGAAKFSGKTQKGTSIGILESVTQREFAQVDSLGDRTKEVVEPLTNYFVSRLQQGFRGGNTVVGGMFTAVNRDKNDFDNIDFLHESAYTGGFDFIHRSKEQTWFTAGHLAVSKVNGHATFKNSSGIGTGFNFVPWDIGTKTLRGGPNLRMGSSINNWAYYESDQRKKIQGSINIWHQWGLDNGSRANNYRAWLSYRPTQAFQVSVGPSFGTNQEVLQYVENVELNETEIRYINATLDQKTLDVTIRLNYTINPNLSIQYYGSPFITTGQYSDFKYISDNPMDNNFHNRFHQYSNKQITYNEESEEYSFDEEMDGESDYAIGDPDFNFMQFRSNLVVRWEYIPGSELFLVWSQGNTNFGNPQEALIPGLVNDLFSEKGENIFLVKATYRFIK
ncbi:MAG: hypothetical protein ACI8YQ_003791 [Polaribacter sp.]|jgi:hypothetical protein